MSIFANELCGLRTTVFRAVIDSTSPSLSPYENYTARDAIVDAVDTPLAWTIRGVVSRELDS